MNNNTEFNNTQNDINSNIVNAQLNEMLLSGKLTEEEAKRLDSAISKNEKRANTKTISKTISSTIENDDSQKNGRVTNWNNVKGKICIEIESEDGDTIDVKLPLKLVNMASKMIPSKTMIELHRKYNIDIMELINSIDDIEDCFDEDLINIESADGDTVRIYFKR